MGIEKSGKPRGGGDDGRDVPIPHPGIGPFGTKKERARETTLDQLIRSHGGKEEKARVEVATFDALRRLASILRNPGDSITEHIAVAPNGTLDRTYNLSEVNARPFREGIQKKQELIKLGNAIRELAPGLIDFTFQDGPGKTFTYTFEYKGN